MLGKIPASPEERKQLLAQKAAEDDLRAQMGLTQVQKRVVDLLHDKGYSVEEIEVNRDFSVELPNASFMVKADICLKLEGRVFCIIKCAMSSPESWERHAVAFGRVAEPYVIPYAVVTDSEEARLMNVAAGKPAGEGLEAIPSREEALEMAKNMVPAEYPAEKREREKLILHAFDAITCSSPLADDKEK
jgi:hypothetical protein